MPYFSRYALATALSVALVAPSVAQEQALDNLSSKLIELRSEVEQINSEINVLKTEHKQEMAYLWSQKNDTQSELDRNQKMISKLQAQLEKKIAENAEKGATSDALKPEFMTQVAELKAYIEQSIPFKKDERLADLAEVQSQVNQNLIATQRGFNKLWALIEDEVRLTKETGIYQQTIQIEGKESKQLVDVVRMGMMTLYFATADGQLGQLKGQPDAWRFEVSHDEVQNKQISALFDALNKQIRTGLFTLPMAKQ